MGAANSTAADRKKASNVTGKRRLSDGYLLGQQLGEGAFGVVHSCTRRVDGEELAVKMYKKGALESEVKTELKALKGLSHENIVAFHGVFFEKGAVCVVMAKYSGGDLIDGLHFQQGLQRKILPHSIVHICSQMAAALQYLHGCSIVHRDIKGDNFLIDRQDIINTDCRIALTDFGVAKHLEPGQRLHDEAGTKRFWCPEIFSHNYGFKVDVWAMGVIVYGLIEARFPFKDSHAILTQHPSYPDGLHPDFKEYLTGMLEKNEHKRSDADSIMAQRWIRSPHRNNQAQPPLAAPACNGHVLDARNKHADASPMAAQECKQQLPAGWMVQPFPQKCAMVSAQGQTSQMPAIALSLCKGGNQPPTLLAGSHAMRMMQLGVASQPFKAC